MGNGTVVDAAVPVRVSGLTGAVAVAAGAWHSAAVKADGTVWAWGDNGSGQLGNGTTTDSSVPAQVQGLSGVVAVAAGMAHTVALKADGSVWAWGQNTYGQVGNGTTTESLVPVRVLGLSAVTAISAGYSTTTALRVDGTVWGWGHNGYGQLATNTNVNALVLVEAQGLTVITAIATGNFHVLALRADGTVAGAGYNASGQLGNNGSGSAWLPVEAVGLSEATAVAAAGYQSFARRRDGSVAGWGYNAYGQLTGELPAVVRAPRAISSLAGATAVTAGLFHGLALRPDGSIGGWGYNGQGAVGDGTTTDRPAPVPASGYNRGITPLATYAYNPDGSRSAKTVTGTTTTFTWDRAAALPMLLAQTTTGATTRIVYGPGGLPLAEIDPAGATTWYHHDQLGSTRLTTTNTGTITSTTTYDPYGQPAAQTGTTPLLGYTGEYTDTETGLQYLRARYYDQSTGQFLTRDPIVAQTRSAYGYVGGNPLNLTDPSGLKTRGICLGGQISFLIHFSAQACVVTDDRGGAGVTGSVGAGAGTPSAGLGIVHQTSDAEHVRDLNGAFSYAGGSVGPIGREMQWGHSCAGKPITVENTSLGKSWGPAEIHVGISYTGLLASGATDPCSPLPPFDPFRPFGTGAVAFCETGWMSIR